MTIIIDGYNVLKQFLRGHIDDKQRKQFVSDVVKYLRAKQHRGIVVFDGDGTCEEYNPKNKSIQVVFAGTKMSADDAIKELINKYLHQDLLLVSDDRELNEYSSERDVVSIGSRDFYLWMKDVLCGNTQKNVQNMPIKISRDTNESFDEYMSKVSVGVKIKAEDELVGEDMQSNKKRSKIERLLEKQIKKL